MTSNRRILWRVVASGVFVFAVQSADAKHWQSAGSRPGIGVSGIGVSAVFVPASGVSTPTIQAWIEQFAKIYAQKPAPGGQAW